MPHRDQDRISPPEALAVCLLFGAWLLAPGAARLVLGESPAFENRAPAERPRFEAARLLDTGYYDGVSAWMEDRLPLRYHAVSAVAHLDLELFGDSPDPQVWLGKGDWLWLDDALRTTCVGPGPDAALDAIAAVEEMLHRSGRVLRWTVVPNKISVYPEHATERVARAAQCGDRRREELLELLRARPSAGYIDLFGTFGSVRDRFDHLLYYPDDSHVSEFGSVVMVQQFVSSIAPGLWDPDSVRPRPPALRTGDLARMIVARGPIEVESWGIERPAVSPLPSAKEDLGRGGTRWHFRTEGPEEALLPDLVFGLHDSQYNLAMALSRPFLKESIYLRWNAFEPERVAREMAAARVVFIEVVERDLYWRFARQLGAPEFLDALALALRVDGPGPGGQD